MTPWADHLQSEWFALALSAEVRARPLARTLLDRPVVLARLDGGDAVAFEDRCPHRQAPLSQGRVVGDSLQCPYHGWRFGRGGGLCAIPGLPHDAPLPAVSARRLGVREHDGIVWVQSQPDATRPLPALALAQSSAARRFLWSTCWQAGVVDALENVLDATHTHFVHAGLVRSPGRRRTVTATMATHASGFSVDYAGDATQSGLIYRLFESRRTREVAHFAAPASVQFEYGYRNGSEVRISLHFAPETAASTRLHVAFHVRGRWAPAWAVRGLAWPFLRRVALQDAAMLAQQSRNRRLFPERRDALGPLDIVRPWLDACYRDGIPAVTAPRTFQIDL